MKFYSLNRSMPSALASMTRQYYERTALYGAPHECLKHQRSMSALAELANQPLHTIAPLYKTILAEMRPRASIIDYLPVLVAKRVKSLLNVRAERRS